MKSLILGSAKSTRSTVVICFDFEKKYGEIGKDFIEAHHLTAISNLKKGETRKTTDKDFAMLCSNCHRMIHRLEDSSDMEKLKSIIGNNDR